MEKFSIKIAIEYLRINRFIRDNNDSVFSMHESSVVVKQFNKHSWKRYGSFNEFKKDFLDVSFEEVFYDEDAAFLFSNNKK